MARKPVTVSQLNTYIERVMVSDPLLGSVSVVGEVSNLTYHSSGHVYFSLKDRDSVVKGFIGKSVVRQLRYRLTEGMEIVAHGNISVFKKGGYYSLNVKDVEISGEGALNAAFIALYEKLQKEGLFDAGHKKSLPAYPKRIAVATSPTGDALRDILKIVRSRNSVVNVLVYPCRVQGDGAAAEIAGAIDDINKRFSDIDIIITGRGGGSKEELWAFNEEIVARSIFASRIPVISAVGHETDFSISDYAADMRAETPTAAAVMAVPDTYALRDELDRISFDMREGLQRSLRMREMGLSRHEPQVFINGLRARTTGSELRVDSLRQTMSANLNIRLDRAAYRLDSLDTAVSSDIKARLEKLDHRIEGHRIVLDAGNPEQIISRGYAVIQDPSTGKVLTQMEDFADMSRFTVTTRDAVITADTVSIEERKL